MEENKKSLTDEELKTLVDFTKVVKKKPVELRKVAEILGVDLEEMLKHKGGNLH